MPLSDKEKTETRDAIGLALELNEPESMIESLRRLCARKEREALMSDNERARWMNARQALDTVSKEIERANAPQARPYDAQSEQSEHSAA